MVIFVTNRFLIESCRLVIEKGGRDWLLDLRQLPCRHDVQNELIQLPGIGKKVADCVALFSLDQSEVVPVDTHVWDIVVRDYDPSLADAKSLTPSIYDQVGDTFRRVFPLKAGWAHSLLFAVELPEFKKLLPSSMQEEMTLFASSMKSKKLAKKMAKKRLLEGNSEEEGREICSVKKTRKNHEEDSSSSCSRVRRELLDDRIIRDIVGDEDIADDIQFSQSPARVRVCD